MATNPLTLPLSELVDVEVSVSPQLPAQPTFNQGLIVGPSTHISAQTRLKQYTSLAGMAADGFLITDPEYIAASLYFSQNPAAQFLWVGCIAGGETPLQAVQACRAAGNLWWAVYVTSAQKADHVALAQWAQTAQPNSMYIFDTADSDVPLGTAGNVFLTIKAQNYERVIGIYSTDQGAVFPNNNYAGAALMGVAMGLNTGLAGSYYTLKFKQLVGVAIEPLTQSEVTNIAQANGNVYLSYGGAYSIFAEGVLGDAQFFDEVLNIDMLASDIQYTLVDIMVSNPAVPITDAGMTQFIHGVNAACDRARVRGFLGKGEWTGRSILNLQTGDPLPNGYLAQSPAANTQSQADRQARKALPIYVAILEGEAAHSIVVGIQVQR